MTYNDGKLTVPISGRYYIYLYIYYHNNGRVHLLVNNKIVTMTQPMKTTNSEGGLYAGGVFKVKAGDVIMAKSGTWPTPTSKVYMWTYHCYFGAFLIWARSNRSTTHKGDNITSTSFYDLRDLKARLLIVVLLFCRGQSRHNCLLKDL